MPLAALVLNEKGTYVYGIDSSAGGFVSPQTLKAIGRPLAFGYLVSDPTPEGRGFTKAEVTSYLGDGIEVGSYWEGSASWMTNGYAAGVAAAENFEANREARGLPKGMVGHFAHDIDPQLQHFPAIEQTVRGINSVIGTDRTWLYGGWLLIDHFAGTGLVGGFSQTLAWEYGRGVHPEAALYQYGFDAFFDDVNCDLIVSLKENYGQASRLLTPQPTPVPAQVYPAIALPEWFARAEARRDPSRAKDHQGNTWYPQRGNVTTVDDTVPRTEPRLDAPAAGPHVPKGTKMPIHWAFESGKDEDREWYVNNVGYWPGSQFADIIRFPGKRAKKAA